MHNEFRFLRKEGIPMDIQSLLGQLLSPDSLEGLSKASGASKTDVKKVLTQALPLLLSGADNQAKSSDTSESFTKALAQHAKEDTSDLGSFLSNLDLADGAKIIGHLLGADTDSATKTVAKGAGVSKKKTATILSSAAPLLMTLLGQQADSDEKKGSAVGDLMGALLENVDVGSLLISILGDSGSSKKTKKKASSSPSIGTIIGKVLKSFLK